jgi:hypothetical protein
MRIVLSLCLLFIGFSTRIPLAISDCAEELAGSAQSPNTPWGQGKMLRLKDMKDYIKTHNIKPPVLTYAAMHYRRAHREALEMMGWETAWKLAYGKKRCHGKLLS